MRHLLADYARMREAEPVGRAVVTSVWGSAPQAEGATMLVSAGGRMAGSVSGGCVETAVAEEVQEAIARGTAKLVRYGITDEAMKMVEKFREKFPTSGISTGGDACWRLGEWSGWVGPRIAGHSRAVDFRDGTLFVEVEGSAWMHELGFLKRELVRTINQHLGAECVKDVRFNVSRGGIPK